MRGDPGNRLPYRDPHVLSAGSWAPSVSEGSVVANLHRTIVVPIPITQYRARYIGDCLNSEQTLPQPATPMKSDSDTRPNEPGHRSPNFSDGFEPTRETREANSKVCESETPHRVRLLDEPFAASGAAEDSPESAEVAGAVHSLTRTGSQSDSGGGAYIPPWYVLAGLGRLERAAVCDMLALFECFSVANKGIDQVRDWTRRQREGDEYQPAFERRVRERSLELSESDRTTDGMRFQLWCVIRERLGTESRASTVYRVR